MFCVVLGEGLERRCSTQLSMVTLVARRSATLLGNIDVNFAYDVSERVHYNGVFCYGATIRRFYSRRGVRAVTVPICICLDLFV